MNPEILTAICTMKMPFGKYKGMVLADLPVSYLEWFERQGFPKNKFGELLSTLHVIKSNGLEYLLKPIREGKAF